MFILEDQFVCCKRREQLSSQVSSLVTNASETISSQHAEAVKKGFSFDSRTALSSRSFVALVYLFYVKFTTLHSDESARFFTFFY